METTGLGTETRTGLTPRVVEAAFDTVGRYLAERERLGEVAVYGGSAIMLQFDWRRSTQDVDAVVTGGDTGVVHDAVLYAATLHGLPDDWLNDAVGAYTAEPEDPSFLVALGDFPRDGGRVGLRVFLARPSYLCAMKLAALERGEERDLADVVGLARSAGLETPADLLENFAAFFPHERLGRLAAERLGTVAEALAP